MVGGTTVTGVEVHDVRFPTSRTLAGSDAMNRAPDCSAASVELHTDDPDLTGYGMTFTVGRGTEIVVAAIHALWKLLADMSPAELVRCVDFRYMTDVLTPEQAVELLAARAGGKAEREAEMRRQGYPAYSTSVGWLGFSDEEVRRRCRSAVAEGWNDVKVKVGGDLEADVRRAAIIREEIGPGRRLMMMDANQVWEVDEAIAAMARLAEFDR
jgi:L-alanine-DL-glutamate epimerase-like enolase superfamily enzyme